MAFRRNARTDRRYTRGTGRIRSSGFRPLSRSISKIRRRRPTARNQQRQIMNNSFQLAKIWKRRYQHRVYCDYQYYFIQRPTFNEFQALRLTDVSNWLVCMRQDQNVLSSSKTFVKRMQISLTYDMGSSITPVWFSFYLVRVRHNYSSYDPTSPSQPMLAGTHYVVNQLDDRTPHPWLNQGIFKVIHSKLHCCAYNSISQDLNNIPALGKDSTGNPNTTWGSLYWDVPLKMNLTQPVNQSWHNKAFGDLPYYDRLYLLVLPGCDAAIPDPPLTPRISGHILYTTINTD